MFCGVERRGVRLMVRTWRTISADSALTALYPDLHLSSSQWFGWRLSSWPTSCPFRHVPPYIVHVNVVVVSPSSPQRPDRYWLGLHSLFSHSTQKPSGVRRYPAKQLSHWLSCCRCCRSLLKPFSPGGGLNINGRALAPPRPPFFWMNPASSVVALLCRNSGGQARGDWPRRTRC